MEKNKKQPAGFLSGSKFIDPEAIVDQLDFENGMKAANFGCGTGYFAIPIAKKVGSDGVVYALDVRKEKLEVIESQAKLEGLNNIETKRVNLEIENGSGLSGGSVDWVVMANMLFQNKNKEAILFEANRVIRKKGKILIIEWEEKDFPIGPVRKRKIPKKEMIKIAQKNSLKVIGEIKASNFHYGLILTR